MNVLPQTGKKFTHIIHIADIHVRIGNPEVARVKEYAHVFDRFYKQISEFEHVTTSLLVIAGDVFHSKCRLESAATKVFFNWINKLLTLLPIVVICGNHDFKQDAPEVTDSIDMFVEPYTGRSIYYLKETGHYVLDNVGIGVVSVKDTLRMCNTAGRVDELPAFPDPTEFRDVDINVALFHGTVTTSKLQGGRNAEAYSTSCYPLAWFTGYDFVLLGDNHKQQTGVHADMQWGYPGSLVQQDFGEPLRGHGYLLWDINNRTVQAHDVPNEYGMITIDGSGVYVTPKTRVDFQDATELPKHPRVRVLAEKDQIDTVLAKLNVVPKAIKIATVHPTDNRQEATTTLTSLSDTTVWDTFIKNTAPELSSIYVHDPKQLLICSYTLPAQLNESIQKRNEITSKLLNVYDTIRQEANYTKSAIVFKYIQWSYLMCYGKDNYFNFETVENKVALLNGPNAVGKSSFFDIISIAIFGEPTLLRREFSGNKMSAKIINDKKPHNEYSGCALRFQLNDNLFEIHRSFTHQSADTMLLREKVCAVYELRDDAKHIVAEGTSTVSKWVKDKFGTIDEIMMSVMLCQVDTNNFFYKKSSEQFTLLEKALNMNAVTAYINVLEESIKAHKYVLDKLIVYTDGLKDANTSIINVSKEDIVKLKTTLQTLEAEHGALETDIVELHSIVQDSSTVQDILEPTAQLEQYSEEFQAYAHITDEQYSASVTKQTSLDIEKRQIEAKAKELGIELTTDVDIDSVMIELHNHIQQEPRKPDMSLKYIEDKLAKYAAWVNMQPQEWIKNPKKAKKTQVALQKQLDALKSKQQLFDHECPHKTADKPLDTLIAELEAMPKPASIKIEIASDWVKHQPKFLFEQDVDAQIINCERERERIHVKLDELYNNAVTKPTMPPVKDFKHSKEYTITFLQNELVNLKHNLKTPCRDQNQIEKWKKQWKEWCEFANNVSDSTSTELLARKEQVENYVESIQTKQREHDSCATKLSSLKDELSELSKVEFNPECWACCKQPRWLRIQDLKTEIENMTKQYKRYHKSLKDVNIADYQAELRALKHDIPARLRYEQLIDTMSSESEIYEQAIGEHETYNNTQQLITEYQNILTTLQWNSYNEWHTRVANLQAERETTSKKLETYVKFKGEYAQYCALKARRAYDDLYAQTYGTWLKTCNDLENEQNVATNFINSFTEWATSLEELYAQKEIAQIYSTWQSEYTELENAKTTAELCNEYTRVLRDISENDMELYSRYAFLRDAMNQCKRKIAFDTLSALNLERRAVQDKISNTKAELISIEKQYNIQLTTCSQQCMLAMTEMQGKLKTLQEFHTVFVGSKTVDGFKTWMYKTVVIPLIEKEINQFIQSIDHFKINIALKNGVFIYTLDDRDCNPTLDHASGYQRFVLGLAMRVALSRLGAVGQNIKHLFIDEGFTACDATNINKVGDIIDIIKECGGYRSIILMSHLDTIRDITSTRIDIQRSEPYSSIRYGPVVQIGTTVKKGR